MAVDVAVLRTLLVADTANYSRGLSKADAQAGRFERNASRSFTKVGAAAKAAGKVAGVALAAGLAVGFKKAIVEAREADKAMRQTSAAIKSTGGVANVSAKQIERLSNAVSVKAGKDDEAVQSAANLLLTFTKVRDEAGKTNQVFSRAVPIIADVSAAFKRDLNSSAIQVGKALNDPVKGVMALTRMGIQFTTQQKDQIKTLVESGKTLQAQKLIMKELEVQTKGSAEANADPFDRFKVSVDNLAESFGTALMPSLASATTAVANFVSGLQNGEGGGGRFADNISRGFANAKTGVTVAVNAIKTVTTDLYDSIKQSLGLSGGDLRQYVQGLVNVFNIAKTALGTFAKVWMSIFNAVILPVIKRVLPAIKAIFEGTFRTLGGIVKVFAGILTLDFGKMWEGVKQIFSGQLKVLGGILRAATAPLRAAAAAAAKGIWSGIKAAAGAVYAAGKFVINKAMDAIRSAPGFRIGRAVIGKVVDGVKSIGGALLDIGKWITNQIKKGLGKIVPDIKLPDLNPFGSPSVGEMGKATAHNTGTYKTANKIASKFGLRVTSGYRSPQHNAAVGGVPNSKHTHGSPGNPGAIDLVGAMGAMQMGAAYARNHGVPEVLVHNAGSGMHLHLGFFRQGGKRGGKAGPGQGGPSVVYGEGSKAEWWVSQEGDRNKNIGYAMEALSSLTGNRLKMFKEGGSMGASGIKNLWTRAGGSKKVATTMTAIALAESRGKTGATNRNTNGTIDKGLWQINSVHGFKGNLFSAFYNAKAAVSVFKKQGLGAWATYNNGAYKSFLDAASVKPKGQRRRRRGRGANRSSAAPRSVEDMQSAAREGLDRSIELANLRDQTAAVGGSDIDQARIGVSAAERGLSMAREFRDPVEIAQAELALAQARQTLSDAQAAPDNSQAILDALTAIHDEMKRTRELADRTHGINVGEVNRMFMDWISGQLGGRGAASLRTLSRGAQYA